MPTATAPSLHPSATDILRPNFRLLKDKMAKAFAEKPDCFCPLLENSAPDPEIWSRVARVKRFLELWTADATVRAAVAEDAQGFIDREGLDLPAEEVRYLYDEAYCRKCLSTPGWKAPLLVQQYRLWCSEKVLHRELIRVKQSQPRLPRHQAWRERQIRRTLGQLGRAQYENIVHAPFALELSDGCSVGCWFCGVSAEKRKTDFARTPENTALWRGVLFTLREIVGPAAAQGFCYWATDPLDNPHYEDFCLDFAEICGRFPQTTTAQAQKHLERLRRLLPLSRQHGCQINRFSILSLGILKKVHEAFTPEELLWTELVTQNMEATSMQSNSGRARGSARLQKKAEITPDVREGWEEAPGTIACVSGFLINMVQRTVKLVTPVPSCDRWPNGYWIFEEATFSGTEDFRQSIEGMIERHMPVMPRLSDRLRFRRDLRFSAEASSFRLQAWGATTTYQAKPAELAIAQAVADGEQTCGEIILAAEDRHQLPAEEALLFLTQLLEAGLLDEEPA